MKLVVGLGNPGGGYAQSRHNLGFMCLAHFARTQGVAFDKKQGKARTGTGRVGGETVILARPQTFMNLSGESVSLLVQKFKIELDDLLVVHDDLDLPLGRIRLRKGGGSGGHKGIESIIACLGSRDFARLRVGIGRPNEAGFGSSEEDVISYVLNDFTPDEEREIDKVIPRVSEAILCFLTDGLAAAMNRYNTKEEA
jgi:peptidyl-tRNA hydrolase, PTH1 family